MYNEAQAQENEVMGLPPKEYKFVLNISGYIIIISTIVIAETNIVLQCAKHFSWHINSSKVYNYSMRSTLFK